MCASFNNVCTNPEDHNYSFQCQFSFSFTPNTLQFDTGLVVFYIKETTVTNSSPGFYYFNIGQIQQINVLPTISGLDIRQIMYGSITSTPPIAYQNTNRQFGASIPQSSANTYTINQYSSYIWRIFG